MRRNRSRVAACDRPRQRAVAHPEGIVERGAEQRCDQPLGIIDARVAQEIQALGHEGDEVVRAVGKSRVIGRAVLLGDPERLATHLDDERLCHRPQHVGGGDPEGAVAEPGEVQARAGEGHHGVQGQRKGTHPGSRIEHSDAESPGRVAPELPRVHVAGLGKAGDQRRQRVIGHGDEHEVDSADGRGQIEDRHPRQHCLSPQPRDIRHRGHCSNVMTGPAQGGTEHGTDTSGPDHADAQPRRALIAHRWSLEAGTVGDRAG